MHEEVSVPTLAFQFVLSRVGAVVQYISVVKLLTISLLINNTALTMLSSQDHESVPESVVELNAYYKVPTCGLKDESTPTKVEQKWGEGAFDH